MRQSMQSLPQRSCCCQDAGTPPEAGPTAQAEFRATGRIPLKQGWKAAFGAAEPEAEGAKKPDSEAEQTLPQLANGQGATLTRPRVQSKETLPPPRYSEGTLVDAMQNAWRFIKDEVLRERLKEAKGIGTPATRAEIIKGLKAQHLLAADGKLVVPTAAGLQLFELLRGAAPALVDPGTTAIWEMRLDDVVLGKADFRAVINEIAGEAGRVISVLRNHTGAQVDLSRPPVARGGGKRSTARKAPASGGVAAGVRAAKAKGVRAGAARFQAKSQSHDDERFENARPQSQRPVKASATPPTERMIAFAKRLAADKKAKLPPGFDTDFEICRKFLDQTAGR